MQQAEKHAVQASYLLKDLTEPLDCAAGSIADMVEAWLTKGDWLPNTCRTYINSLKKYSM